MAGKVVAYLEVLLEGRDPDETQTDIEIRGSEQFYLGRNEAICRQSWPDLVISNKHLRIHCVIYEQDPISEIPPFVYATDLSTNGTYLKKANAECASSQGRGIRMGRNGTFLLDDGDELRLSDSVTLAYHSIKPVIEAPLTTIQQQEKQLFSSCYLITGRVLGVGGFGKVMVALHQRTQRQVACKIIDLRKLWQTLSPSNVRPINGNYEQTHEHDSAKAKKSCPSQMAKCFREFDILKHLSHPNIIAIEKVFWSSNTIYIFQDLVTGGDLFSYLEYKGGRLSEVEAAVIIRQVLIGIKYLHDQQIVHRDLKPDNILMTSLDDGARIVISDFGSARYLPTDHGTQAEKPHPRQRMFSYAGTLEYAAPEIHKMNKTIPPDQGYSKSVDMWSVGAITGILLSGDVIFFNQNRPRSDQNYCEAFLALASRCDLSFLDDKGHRIWRNIGSRPKHFIKSLLTLHEERRMTAAEALTHPWFSNECHAAAFDALYERATRDWQPRRRASRMVESISNMSANFPQPLVSDRLLPEEMVSRYFAPPPRQPPRPDKHERIAVAQIRRANTPLPSIMEEHEFDCGQGEYRSQFSRLHESSCSRKDPMDNSMEHLSLDPGQHEGRYTANQTLNGHEDACVRQGNTSTCTGTDSIYPFSIPNFPPNTPEVEQVDSFHVVPETPVKPRAKRRRDWSMANGASRGAVGTGADEVGDSAEEQDSATYFAQELSKRRKIRCGY